MTFPPDPVLNVQTISNDEDDHKLLIAVYSKDRPETKVVKITTSNKQVEASHEPLSEKEAKSLPVEITRGEKVTINIKSGLPLGVFKEEVIITTDHPKQPEVRLTVTGKLIGAINFQPAALVLHDADGRAGATGELSIVVTQNRPTAFKVAEGSRKGLGPLRVEVVPVAVAHLDFVAKRMAA